jgi:Cys-tRNA(Pro)/Cys-tRNA(Cys) deacylase
VKTNVIRLLESHGIAHTVHTYEVSEDFDALKAAQKLGVDPERVFKTLVASGGGTVHLVFCLPAVLELDLRKAAAVSGSKSVALIRPDDLLALTGYVRGGCSPLAMKKAFPTFLDESAQLFDTIYISGGQRGVQVGLAPADLLALGQTLLPRCELSDLS